MAVTTNRASFRGAPELLEASIFLYFLSVSVCNQSSAASAVARGTGATIGAAHSGQPMTWSFGPRSSTRPAFGHFLGELLVSELHPHAEVDEHIGHRAIAGTLPVAWVGHVGIGFGVVHVADDMQDRALGQQRLGMVGIGVAAHPVVVVADAGQRFHGVAPDRLQTHALAGGVQMGLEGDDLDVVLERRIGVEFLVVLVAGDADVDAVAKAEPDPFILGLIADGMKAEADFEMAGGVLAIGMQVHRVGNHIGAGRSSRPASSSKMSGLRPTSWTGQEVMVSSMRWPLSSISAVLQIMWWKI